MSSARFKIITLNTHLMDGTAAKLVPHIGTLIPRQIYKDEQRMYSIANYLRNSDADFVGLTEVWADTWKESIVTDSRYRSHYYPLTKDKPIPLGSGLLNLSRHKLYDGSFSKYKDLEGEDWWLSQKGYTRATLYLHRPGRPSIRMYIFTTHAQAGNSDKQVAARNKNMWQLAGAIEQLPRNSVVVLCGDLNVVGEGPKGNPTKKQYHYLSEQMERVGLVDAYRTVYPDAKSDRGYTYDAANNSLIQQFAPGEYEDKLRQRLDYVYVGSRTRNVSVESARVIAENVPGTDIPFSDHYGLEVTISIA